jgi:hypothetical protein
VVAAAGGSAAAPQVAIIILGQIRSFLTPKVQNSQRLLVEPLQRDFGANRRISVFHFPLSL